MRGSSSSSEDEGVDGTIDGEDVNEKMDIEEEVQPNVPIIDEDGFQLVQGKGRRKGR